MRFTHILLAFTIGLLLVSGCSDQKSTAIEGNSQVISSVNTASNFRLSVEIPRQKYVAQKNYLAKLSLTNLGDSDFTFDMGRIFGFSVLDKDNNLVWPDGSIPPLKEFHLVTIGKGKTYRQDILFTVNNPGTYKVISRMASGEARQVGSRRIKREAPPKLATEPITVTFE